MLKEERLDKNKELAISREDLKGFRLYNIWWERERGEREREREREREKEREKPIPPRSGHYSRRSL